jgi:hypothetical protein
MSEKLDHARQKACLAKPYRFRPLDKSGQLELFRQIFQLNQALCSTGGLGPLCLPPFISSRL